jgi:hypothetical protein
LIPALLLVFFVSGLPASGRKSKIETAAAEGGEIWQNEFDVTARKQGKYNIIIRAKDKAGNEAESGPFNLMVDPNAGLPAARVVYPENNAVLRQDISLIGVASGRFGVNRVMVRLDDGDARPAEGTDYWSRTIGIRNLSEGRHTVYVMAFDSKGVSGPETSVGFLIDKGPPLIELLSHKAGDLISGNLNISGRAGDPNGISSVLFSADGETWQPLSLKTRKGETGVEFSFPAKTRGMDDGPLVYYIRALDKAGTATTKPCLFFVDNKGPELQIFTPDAAEDVYGKFILSGYIHDTVGLDRFYYEWGGSSVDIMRKPGDPFWSAEMEITPDMKNAGSVKVSAVDKSGNITSLTRKLEDRRRIKVPALVIDYPPQSRLNALAQDASIYGHIAPGFFPEAIVIEGGGEDIPALPSFRISPDMIPNGRSVLKIIPRSAEGLSGTPLSIRVNKPAPAAEETLPQSSYLPSPVTLASPEKYAYFGGSAIKLEGQAQIGGDALRLEYRFFPEDAWRLLSVDAGGNFSADVSVSSLPAGPVHLELRTIRGGMEDIPLYHPFNRVDAAPEIEFIAPSADLGSIQGNVTVLGTVSSSAPLTDISCSIDGKEFSPLPYVSGYGKAWFSYFCDFASLNASGGQLVIRAVDASGAVREKSPSIRYDQSGDIPALIVNTPNDGDVISGDFEISGIAFDDDQVDAVYWRIRGPDPASPGSAGEAAKAGTAAAPGAGEEFHRLSTSQSFQIPVSFSDLIDGEFAIDIYAEDIYGIKSEVATRNIKLSTAAPETEITEPVISVYNRKAVVVRGISRDANGIARVFLSMDNGNTFQRATLGENNEWTLGLNTSAYRDGVYSALIRAEDNYGVQSFMSAMINIDNSPPDLSVGKPENGERVGARFEITGRVQDNIHLKNLTMQIINTRDPENQRLVDLESELVIMESVDMTGFSPGEYIIRMAAVDLAGNDTVVSRKIIYTVDDTSAEVALYNPMPGETHAGPLDISGVISGAFVPEQITLMLNEQPSTVLDVDRYGVFRYSIPEERLLRDETMIISASYNNPAGQKISSPLHSVRYSPYGPSLVIDSHRDGDVITGRPYLAGRAWIAAPEPDENGPSRGEKAQLAVKAVQISFDNGRSFGRALGGGKWKFRLETGDLPLGPLPVLIKADFVNGQTAVRRLLLTVDTNAPVVETLAPAEDSTNRDSILVYGTAGDDFELDSVAISLRPGDKFGYSVPGFIQGLYVDTNILGATIVDLGIGLSFFKDNVRFQFQAGMAPYEVDGARGRFVGGVFGFKLLANIFYLPLDFLFGPDWSWYSMSIALGANFSIFTMDPDHNRDALVMGAVLGQWEFIKADISYFFPRWKYCKNIALYFEPVFWFASSDINAQPIFRATLGARVNLF